jgi:hypothetical protein
MSNMEMDLTKSSAEKGFETCVAAKVTGIVPYVVRE